jgi:hypothetical protein
MTMTWKEFKDYIDKELEKLGTDENREIEYIDVVYPDLNHNSTVPIIEINNKKTKMCIYY